jgi:hypothetical protein
MSESRDRRRHRSEVHSVALSLLLDACRARAGLEALVLADDGGLVVSAAVPPHVDVDADEVAAMLPLPGPPEPKMARLRQVRFDLDGAAMYLGGIGEMTAAWAREMLNALRGAQRILAA